MAKGICVIGGGVSAAQCALTLAELGIEVKLITTSLSLGIENTTDEDLWPLLLRAASHPMIALYTNSNVKSITGKPGNFTVKALKKPRYVSEELCTACGRCEAECSVKVYSYHDGHKTTQSAIHASIPGSKSAPSAYHIDKNGMAPCRVSCPLGINVQGFTALLAKGKVDKALSTIIESAPLAAVLGRLCTHPCEAKCTRSKVDEPLFIKALHRYAADNAPGGIQYIRKNPAGSRKEKIAIVGSGPAGLTAAWELTRRGYSPTIFESHGVIGGMLATGVPRFRLPREVREREVEAIKSMGIDIKTGVTVGRDVTYSDLIERGYKAFFLAIGAQQNNKLNIPGEDLDGVVDSMSLLFALNLKVGAVVGANVVVIGGGNSAVDCARTAKRRSKGVVRVLCITKEMTAVKEDVDEAIKEGIQIDYLVSVVEILGDGQKVTGIKCQRLKKVEFTPDGVPIIEPIPDSDFTIEADHVVVSIGQKPNTPALNIKALETRGNHTIKIDSLTLGTNIPGVFAGGDCVTGPNNVVSAMGAGLQAAESIDRYLRGHDLKKGRSLEKPEAAEVDIGERKASPYRRARMPAISVAKRKGTYEETSLGLPENLAKREAERCLNCAICSECKECEQVCEPGAVFHEDAARQLDIGAAAIINFTHNGIRHPPKKGAYYVNSNTENLVNASAIAMEAAIALRASQEEQSPDKSTVPSVLEKPPSPNLKDKRIGVFLCRCGESINQVIDFAEVTREISRLPGVSRVWEVSQTCREEGSYELAEYVTSEKLDRIVLAACRCCNLEQVCLSCTDRRVLCKRYLGINLPTGTAVEYVNIREQCARVHTNDPAGATLKAIDLISAGVARASRTVPAIFDERPVAGSALVFSSGPAGEAAARDIAALGYPVTLVSHADANTNLHESVAKVRKQLEGLGVQAMPYPQSLELSGCAGNYEAVLKYDSHTSRVVAGALVLDMTTAEKVSSLFKSTPGSLLYRILSRNNGGGSSGFAPAGNLMFQETAGIFIISSSEAAPTTEQQRKIGSATAASAAAYMRTGLVSPRLSAVRISKELCRGCGDCAVICPYIEMKVNAQGIACACVDPALCYGCGACLAVCPTGAIIQAVQSEIEMTPVLEALLAKAKRTGETNVLVFACNWAGLSCIEAAAQQGLHYPASVRVLRVPCLSRVHAGLILKAFELGADGVMLLGCEGNCHFGAAKETISRHYDKARTVLGLLGIEEERLSILRLPAGDGSGFVKSVTGLLNTVEHFQARNVVLPS